MTVFTVGRVSFEMVPVDGGTFTMGGTIEQRSEPGSSDRPEHKVVVDSYLIGKTEVTRSLWKAVMNEDAGDWLVDDLPIEWVSWYQCQEFIRRLDSITGAHFRLPTEAEWEFAARGGNKAERQYRYAGSMEYEDVGWLYLNSGNRTHNVGEKQPNALGLYDMTGNVWEWCQDWFGMYSQDTQIDPKGPSLEQVQKNLREDDIPRKVVRGSSWDNAISNSRLSVRQGRDPEYSFYDCGLRLAMDDARTAAERYRMKNDSVRKVKVGSQSFTIRRVAGAHKMISTEAITQGVWKAAMRYNPSTGKQNNKLPVNNTTVRDQNDFIFALDSITGMHFRLATEDEWPEGIVVERTAKVEKKTASRKERKAAKSANIARELFGFKAKEVPEDETLAVFQRQELTAGPLYVVLDLEGED